MNSIALPDRYEVISELGSGGMGKVYLVLDTTLKKSVAIKVLATDSLEHDPERLQRFQREAKAAGRMRHENLVSVMDFGLTSSGQPYLVMDYVEGPTLKEVIDSEGPFTISDAVDILSLLASAIAHAHVNGVVHRDLKASNVVLADYGNGRPKPVIIDFGIALMMETDADRSLHLNLTRTNAIIGSPHYMSPEQVQGERADERSDIYSLGCIFYECLIGHPPYQGESLMAIMEMHLREPVPKVKYSEEQADLADRLNLFLERAMAKEPSQRFAGMQEVIEAINAINAIEGNTSGSIAHMIKPLESERQPDSPPEHSRRQVFLILGLLILFITPVLFVLFPAGTEDSKTSAAIEPYNGTAKKKSTFFSTGEDEALDQRTARPEFISTKDLNRLVRVQNSEKNGKLDLSGYKISSAKLNLLAQKPYLSNLILSDCYFDDPSAFGLLESINLNHLTVSRSNFDDTAAGEVAKFKQLKSINATECRYLSSKGIKAVAENASIISLEIGGPELDDDALKYIALMPGLRMLTVKQSQQVSDKGIAHLAGMKLTKLLLINDYRLSNESLKYISTLKNLTKLDLRGSYIVDPTGDHLKSLRGLKRLKELHILKEQTSIDAIERLKKMMPDCQFLLGEPDL